MPTLFGRSTMHFLVAIFLLPQSVYCADQDPVKFIKEFYTWYISVPSSIDAIESYDIYRYVAQ